MPLFEKNVWKKLAQQYLYVNHPELVPLFTTKIIDNACHYMDGYGDSLIENVNPPHNENDIRVAISDAGIKRAILLIQQSAK